MAPQFLVLGWIESSTQDTKSVFTL